MKSLPYITIAAFLFWLSSECIKAFYGSYVPAIYYLNTAYHLLAALGIWGLHFAPSLRGGKLSYVSVALISLSFLVLSFYPVALMKSGLTPVEYLATVPHFQVAGLVNLIGFVLFGVTAMLEPKFPRWTGIAILVGSAAYKAAIPLSLGWLSLVSCFAVVLVFSHLSTRVIKLQ